MEHSYSTFVLVFIWAFSGFRPTLSTRRRNGNALNTVYESMGTASQKGIQSYPASFLLASEGHSAHPTHKYLLPPEAPQGLS
jgi:hypothetical protein